MLRAVPLIAMLPLAVVVVMLTLPPLPLPAPLAESSNGCPLSCNAVPDRVISPPLDWPPPAALAESVPPAKEIGPNLLVRLMPPPVPPTVETSMLWEPTLMPPPPALSTVIVPPLPAVVPPRAASELTQLPQAVEPIRKGAELLSLIDIVPPSPVLPPLALSRPLTLMVPSAAVADRLMVPPEPEPAPATLSVTCEELPAVSCMPEPPAVRLMMPPLPLVPRGFATRPETLAIMPAAVATAMLPASPVALPAPPPLACMASCPAPPPTGTAAVPSAVSVSEPLAGRTTDWAVSVICPPLNGAWPAASTLKTPGLLNTSAPPAAISSRLPPLPPPGEASTLMAAALSTMIPPAPEFVIVIEPPFEPLVLDGAKGPALAVMVPDTPLARACGVENGEPSVWPSTSNGIADVVEVVIDPPEEPVEELRVPPPCPDADTLPAIEIVPAAESVIVPPLPAVLPASAVTEP